MAKHLTEQEIEVYRQRKGTLGNREKTEAHLAVCRPCLERVVDSGHSALAVDALTEALLPSAGDLPFHLSHAELKSYVGGSIAEADQIICESHLEICDQCNEELRLLTTAQRPQSAQEFARPRSNWRFLTPPRLAAAVALIGLLTLAALVWWQLSSRPTRQESVSNGAQVTPGVAASPGSIGVATPQPANESVASNPPVVGSLKDNNREIRLDQEGRVTGLEGFDESSQKMARAALAGESLAEPRVLDDLSPPPIRLLGKASGEQTFDIIGPARRVITEARPTMRWQPLSGATNYVISIFDNNFNRVATSPPLSKTNWTVGVPLQRGQTYSWEVTATKDGKQITAPVAPDPRAQFKLLEADKLSALSKLKQQKPVSHLALGLMYASFGLVNDAEDEFRKLVKENPDSALAKKLLRTVQKWHSR